MHSLNFYQFNLFLIVVVVAPAAVLFAVIVVVVGFVGQRFCLNEVMCVSWLAVRRR